MFSPWTRRYLLPRCHRRPALHLVLTQKLQFRFSDAKKFLRTLHSHANDSERNKHRVPGLTWASELPTDETDESLRECIINTFTAAEKKKLDPRLLDPHDDKKFSRLVRQLLEQGDEHRAIRLVRLASESHQCPRSWVQVVKWLGRKRDFKNIMLAYHEMIKHGQSLSGPLYTDILFALSAKPVTQFQLQEGLKLYERLCTEHRTYKNMIHTTVILNICASARDLETFWRIAEDSIETGKFNEHTLCAIFRTLRIQMTFSALAQMTISRCTGQARSWWKRVRNWERSGRITMTKRLVATYFVALQPILKISGDRGVAAHVLKTFDELLNQNTEYTHEGKEAKEPGSVGLVRFKTSLITNMSPHAGTDTPHLSAFQGDAAIISSVVLACRALQNATGPSSSDMMWQYWGLMTKKLGMKPSVKSVDEILAGQAITGGSSRSLSLIEMAGAILTAKGASVMERAKVLRGPLRYAMEACAVDAFHCRTDRHGEVVSPSAAESVPGSIITGPGNDTENPLRICTRQRWQSFDNAVSIIDLMHREMRNQTDDVIFCAQMWQSYLHCAVATHTPPLIIEALHRLQVPSRLLMGRMRDNQAPQSYLDIPKRIGGPINQEPWWDGDELMKYQYAVLCTMTEAESHGAFEDSQIRHQVRGLAGWRDEYGEWLEARNIPTEPLQPQRLDVHAQKMQGYKAPAARGGASPRRIDHRAWTQLSILVDAIGGFTSNQDIHA